MRRISPFSIILLLVFLIGCNSQYTQPTTISTPPTNTATLTGMLTPTGTASPIPEQTTIQFPGWVTNPETQILLVPVIELDHEFNTHYQGLSLFNAETSERFDIPFTNQKGDYFWVPDGSGFGFLPKESHELFFFSIKEEKFTTFLMQNDAFRFINQEDSFSQPIQVSSSDFDDPKFLFLPYWTSLSPGKKYFTYYGTYYDGTCTSVFDISSGKQINISNPDDIYHDLYSEWSPTSPLLAIAEVDQSPQMFNSFNAFPTFKLRVYDVQSNQVVASYKNVTFPKWSPDGTKFLFQEWNGAEDFYWYGGSPPCIFDTISGETNCFNELMINDKITITSAYWSPDQSMIGFVYLNFEPSMFNETGSFCILQLSTENTSCLLDKLDIEGQKVVEYSWSPDGNFISFFYDTSYPFSDYRDNPKLGVASIKAGKYFSIGIPSVDTQALGLWRPLP